MEGEMNPNRESQQQYFGGGVGGTSPIPQYWVNDLVYRPQCSNCGYCPHCGRGNNWYPQYPIWQVNPWGTWC